MENFEPSPFSFEYSSSLAAILQQLRISVALTTYQAGRVILLSSTDGHNLEQRLRRFRKPMGLHFEGNRAVLATKQEVLVFQNAAELAKSYPEKKAYYDALYVPRLSLHTGVLDIHDVAFGPHHSILAVNTAFSCIVSLDGRYNFNPIWRPSFISRLCPEDRCHLNGMVVVDKKPIYATAFNQGDSPKSWRANITQTGVLFDVQNDQILTEGLPMPHSPKMHRGELYLLLSATGDLVKINRLDGSYETVFASHSFARGLSFYEDYAFIGFSRLRKTSTTFAKLNLPLTNDQCGFMVVHLPTGQKVGELRYLNTVNELYEVAIIAHSERPNLLNKETDDYQRAISSPTWRGWRKAKKKTPTE